MCALPHCSTFTSKSSLSVLHPQHKCQYFQDEGWLKEWIQTTVDITHEEWMEYYKPKNVPVAAAAATGDSADKKGKGKAKGVRLWLHPLDLISC